MSNHSFEVLDSPTNEEDKQELEENLKQALELIENLKADSETAKRYLNNLDTLIWILYFQIPDIISKPEFIGFLRYPDSGGSKLNITFDGIQLDYNYGIFEIGNAANFWVPSTYQSC